VTEPVGSATGWSNLGFSAAGLVATGYSPSSQALVGRILPHQTKYRVAGLMSNQSEWLSYSAIGPEQFVRGKFYLYATGEADASTTVTMPNLRVRLSNRFAVSSVLEVFNHINADPQITSHSLELRPSTDPANPSLYMVDFDPVDVPYLAENAQSEGVMRGFEAYSLDPQDAGDVGLVESVLLTYPVTALSAEAAPARVYAATASDAGDLKVFNSATDLWIANLIPGASVGEFSVQDTVTSRPTYAEGPFGITMDSTFVPSDRLGVITREFDPNNNLAARVRVAPGKQYKIRWHVTSTQHSNMNSQLRMRSRSVKFMWTQKYEIGGAYGAGEANNAIAQQALPGVGTQNPDRAPGDTLGGWYTMHMHSPLNAAIRPEFAPGTPLEMRMPCLSAEPGPGQGLASFLDLKVGCDFVDTLSNGPARIMEKGNFTIDRIEVYEYDLVEDDGACVNGLTFE
jgi:hypothetical protein